MASFSLGAGLEGFNTFLDTEAEATVSIKTDDEENEVSSAPAAVEDEIATTEKADEDVDTAADNVNQTMNYMVKLCDDVANFKNLYISANKYGVSSGLVAYANMTFGYESKCQTLGLISATEADAGAVGNDTLSKVNYGIKSIGAHTPGETTGFKRNVKVIVSKAVAMLKALGRRIVEFTKKLFFKIYDFFFSQKKTVEGLITKLKDSSVPDTIEIRLLDKHVQDREMIAIDELEKALNNINTELSSKKILNDKKELDTTSFSDSDTSEGGINRIAEQFNVEKMRKAKFATEYNNKRDILTLLSKTNDVLKGMDNIKSIQKTCEQKIGNFLSIFERFLKKDEENVNKLSEETKKKLIAIQQYCTKIIAAAVNIVKQSILGARLFLHYANVRGPQSSNLGRKSKEEQEKIDKSNKEFNEAMGASRQADDTDFNDAFGIKGHDGNGFGLTYRAKKRYF